MTIIIYWEYLPTEHFYQKQNKMGKTLGNVLISYDVENNHTQVKNKMLELGYKSSWRPFGSDKTYQLPNTTLWHKETTSDKAITDLKNVCNELQTKLEKAVAVKASEFVGI